LSLKYWQVAIDAPVRQVFTYSSHLELKRGVSVKAPFGRRHSDALVLNEIDKPENTEFTIREITESLDIRWPLSDRFVSWLEWLSDYYLHPIGQVCQMAFPPLKKKEGRSRKGPVIPEVAFTQPPQLTDEQANALEKILPINGYQTHLVHGITGSGKTEIYLRLIEAALSEKKQALVLVPEISLTPQLVQRFASRFGDKIAVIHSHLTDREKTEQWWKMVDREKDVLIGARSALFCPIPDLGMIIIDEEHEPSFKQDEKLRYHARDAAAVLAKKLNIPLILGSATPSLESWQNAKSNRYNLIQLKKRVANATLPDIEIVDMRNEKQEKTKEVLPFWMSETLFESIGEALANQQQVALFLNRRGVAQFVICSGCGATRKCPNCSVSLTLHAKNHLVCHYCDYNEPLTSQCPDCRDCELKPFGLGTEGIEDELLKLFPEARISRADRDLIHSRQALDELIFQMEEREIDILVGTQMIAKGLDFKNLTLVGVVLADVGFNMPDFRASERSFQLLTQVSGRSGRHEQKGKVVIQAYNTAHPSLAPTKNQDYESFTDEELTFRRELSYPPFGRLALLKFSGNSEEKVIKCSKAAFEAAHTLTQTVDKYQSVELLGPTAAPLTKLSGKFRYQLLLKGKKEPSFGAFCYHFLRDFNLVYSGVKMTIDIDPFNML
jgi:primosomal protein N' (replication factor Y)